MEVDHPIWGAIIPVCFVFRQRDFAKKSDLEVMKKCYANGCAIINDPLSILRISLLNCDVSTCAVFQKIAHEILHKTL
jgi:hypothetical protein